MVVLLMIVGSVIGTYGTEGLRRPRARQFLQDLSPAGTHQVNSLLQMRKLTLRKSSMVTEL